MTTEAACSSCGTELRQSARFCDECGASTAVPVNAAEYKQVTVLFADVVRSMEIAAVVDIERLRHIMTDLLERSAAVVRRFGGTVEYTGDGVMAIFGAPVALEDHAFRACLAGLALQDEAQQLAGEIQRRDGVPLRLRVRLNSGRVIAGEMGSGLLGYAATGESVGFAQRMESVAPPGGVMLSESTAGLVEHAVILAEREMVRVKGMDAPVPARRLISIRPRNGLVDRADAHLVGRHWEMATLEAIVGRTKTGQGTVVNVTGPPGVGKSRVARETARLATARGIEVHWAFCESHTRDISFAVVAQLFREVTGVAGLEDATARRRLRAEMLPGADPEDLLLLDDLLGIADADTPPPQIDPDARRRRLTALINTASLARTEPALFIVEDAHWIDDVSESLITDFVSVISRTPSMMLITSRHDYDGALMHVPGAQTIALAPLDDSEISNLLRELLGLDPSVRELATIIAERAAGNPFFAEEMVRELVQRGVLTGERGAHICGTDVAEINVPATVQAAIEARIDRLSNPARRTLNAAAVIGARFEMKFLEALDIEPALQELISAEFIDQIRFTRSAEYAFRHPLIRAVAYESQLKSTRAEWHRRVATAVQEHEPAAVEENAALIAEHLESAGEAGAAYGWHMRAGGWSATRDVGAARVSWQRARRLADSVSAADDGTQLAMAIAPLTMLCATDFQARDLRETQGRFVELREMCSAAGDKVSLAIGMTGPATELLFTGKAREAARMAAEQMSLLESMADPTPIMSLSFIAFLSWFDSGEFDQILRWSQTIIELAGGDPARGAGFGVGSPLAFALAIRGVARWWLGRPGWREDLHDAHAMARNSDPATLALILGWTYPIEIAYGVLRPDDSALAACEEAVLAAQRASNDYALGFAELALGVVLVYREAAADRHRGLELLLRSRDMFLRERIPSLVPVTELLAAPESARRGDWGAALKVMRAAVSELHAAGRLGYGVFGTGLLVEALLKRGAEGDLAEAQKATDVLADLSANGNSAMVEITRLRLRTLLARARSDDAAYRELLSCYRAKAESLGFEGHIAWAAAM